MFLCGLLLLAFAACANSFSVGTGISDVTGPSTEINFMGYAVPGQRGTGIHLRLRARAFVFLDEISGKRAAFVSIDGGMASDLVKLKVLDEIKTRLNGQDLYFDDNLAISGTHTHSGPAGFLQYVLYQVTSLGFVAETFDAWVSGIADAVVIAHNNVQPADIYLSEGELYGANINRSPTSYLLNPAEERAKYAAQGDTDKNMLLLEFIAQKHPQQPLGVLNWFAVHGTNMNNTNTLTSGDNKGYASYLLERHVNGADVAVGHGSFVAAFASTNLGDVSPNTLGAKCIDTGEDCDGTSSTCNGRCEKCIGFGPGVDAQGRSDMVQSTKIIGDKQFRFALDLMGQELRGNNDKSHVDKSKRMAKSSKSSGKVKVEGVVDYRHSFVNMPTVKVRVSSSTNTTGNTTTTNSKEEQEVQLCTPAMGYAFAAGTTDGPGMFGFHQGTTSGNPFWDKVAAFLSEPTEEEKACQAPKPILVNSGDMTRPYDWDPKTVPIQIIQIGTVYILAVPCEFTTMAGRRMREEITKVLEENGVKGEIHVTIAGLANSYSSYVVTYEEYQAQRYEAASTIFGPHTLQAYIQEFSRIAKDLATGQPSSTDAPPPDFSDVMVEMMPGPTFDLCPSSSSSSSTSSTSSSTTTSPSLPEQHRHQHPQQQQQQQTRDLQQSYPNNYRDASCFGTLVENGDVAASYTVGQQASATFHAANPRNNPRAQGSYLAVQRMSAIAGGREETVARDGDWDTTFHWVAGKDDVLQLGFAKHSVATITYNITTDTAEGSYRLCYMGDHRLPGNSGVAVPFSGCSSVFAVVA